MSVRPFEKLAEHHSSDLLESWKEIAAYLGRSVRAVQKWEKHEQLPVHRHHHEKQGTIYAYRSEIDTWLESRAASADSVPPVADPAESSPRLRPFVVGLSIAVTAVVLIGVILMSRPGKVTAKRPPAAATAIPSNALSFPDRGWVLVTPFENLTGDSHLDQTIEYALERELTESRVVRVVQRQRVEDTLRLMKKPLETRLTESLAREVSLRDNGIRFLVAGRLEKMDESYSLTARIINPGDATVMETASVEARNGAELPRAIRNLSNRVRELLGENRRTIETTGQKLEKVTTPSLTALRLYSQSVELGNRGQWPAALEVVKRAVAEDPQFASAHIWMAWAQWSRGERNYLQTAERAVRLAETASDWERYWIMASYHSLREDEEAAVANYEALLSFQFDHYFALYNLIFHSQKLGRPSEAVRYAIDAAKLRPNDIRFNALAAWSLAGAGKPDEAQPYVRRVLSLAQQQGSESTEWDIIWANFFDSYRQWARGDMRASAHALDRVILAPAGVSRDRPLKFGILHYLTLGKITSARDVARRIPDEDERNLMLAFTAFCAGDRQTLRNHILRVSSPVEPALTIWLLARVGEDEKAEQILADFLKAQPGVPDSLSNVLRADIEAARGRVDRAISLLEGIEKLSDGMFYRASQTLAELRLRKGDRAEATRILVASWDRAPDKTTQVWSSVFWMGNGVKLAQLYRETGRHEEAHAIEERLASLLAAADSDYLPFVRHRVREMNGE